VSAAAPAPLRVLHVLARDTRGGTELMVASLVLSSDPASTVQEIATLQAPGPIAQRFGERPGALESLGGGGGGVVLAAWRLARRLRSREYDVVNAYGLKASVLARLFVRLRRPRPRFVCGVRALHVTEVERLDSAKARLAALVERLLSPLVDVYDANSRAALDLIARLGVDERRLVHIPNGLDLSRWSPRRGEPDDPPLIVCAARFVPRKRHEDLLNALALLVGGGRSFRAVLAGDGPLLDDMRSLASSLDLDGVVGLPGSLDSSEVRGLLERAAVVCLVSSSEGMPGTLMEGMATGVAVVGTDVGGTNELVVDGDSGLLVPAYDPPALAAALTRLLDDPDLRSRLGAGGRRRMEDCFSLETMVEAKERLYRDLAGVGPRPVRAASRSGSGCPSSQAPPR
jgi:glycosyltransferase involved in cell wall biosynthesis